MMMNTNKSNQKGITLVEVLICVIIVALIIGPLTLNFTMAGKTRVSAERVTEVTNHAEALMAEIKMRITDDIDIMQQYTGNCKASISADDLNRYENIAKDYIELDTMQNMTLGEFMAKKSGEITNSENAISARYVKDSAGNDRYAYEVAIWPLSETKDLSLTDGEIELKGACKTDPDNKVLTLYTDTNYNFEEADINSIVNPVKLKVDAQTVKLFKELNTQYVFNTGSLAGSAEVIDYLKAELKSDKVDNVKSMKEQLKIGTVSEIKKESDTVGLVIPIEPKSGTILADSKKIGVVELDARNLLRDDTGASLGDYSNYTFKIVNNTQNDLTVRVLRSYLKKDDPIQKLNERVNVDNKFHFISVDSTATARTNFEFVDDIRPEQNYFIAIIVREVDPLLGKPGKIVKRLTSIYSYDEAINERR